MRFVWLKTTKHSVLAHLVCQEIPYTDVKCHHKNAERHRNVDQTPFAAMASVF
jgi:hypothetical protein